MKISKIVGTYLTAVAAGMSLSAQAAVTGYWNFENGDLSAVIGSAGYFLDAETQAGTQFGTSDSFGVPGIGGQTTKVLRIHKPSTANGGISLPTGVAANGTLSDGSPAFYGNKYTVIMDVYWPAESVGKYRALFNVDGLGNADWFVKNDTGGLGTLQRYSGSTTSNTWYRLAIAVDLTQNTAVKFINGVRVGQQSMSTATVPDPTDGAHALRPEVWMFQDNSPPEIEVGYVSAVQIRDEALPDALLKAFGGPSATGIPTYDSGEIPELSSTVPRANGSELSNTKVEAVIRDGTVANVVAGSVELAVNGTLVSPTVTKANGNVTISYTPPAALPVGTNTAVLSYADNGAVPMNYTNTWVFYVVDRGFVTGQWDFDSGDLTATVGQPLSYMGATAGLTEFQTLTIGGQQAKVMKFPKMPDATYGYIMPNSASPNGGGTNLNVFTVIMDVMFPPESTNKFRALIQANPANTVGDDTDYYVGSNNGIGISGNYDGFVDANTWHRIVFSMDLTRREMAKFIDGQFVGQQTLAQGVDGRWSLRSSTLLFTDDNPNATPNTTEVGYVNSIQVRTGRMPDADIATLGGATATGIPQILQGTLAVRIKSIVRSGNDLVISWEGGSGQYQVQQSSTLGGGWSNVTHAPGATSVTVPIGTGAKFFRVQAL